MTWILHISDPHLGDVPGKLDDDKVVIEHQPDLETSQRVFMRTLGTLEEFVKTHGKPELVVLSGDLTYANHASGFDAFKKLLSDRAGVFPDDRSRIVVVPGNHDVDWDSRPASKERYEGFLGVTRALGCSTPLLDGIDFDADTGALSPSVENDPHVVATEELLAIPLNSSNFCGVNVTPRNAWTADRWESELAALGVKKTDELSKQLGKLHQQDIARISKPQIEALAAYFAQIGLETSPDGDRRLRIAILHHQLLPLSLREERKPFESLISLQLLREMLRDYGVRVVMHGHKHEDGLYWHSIGPSGGLQSPPHRMLIISSPGRFDVNAPTMRAVMLEGPRRARNARIITFGGAAPGRKHPHEMDSELAALWLAEMEGESRPQTLIAAKDTHTAYARIRSLFALEGEQPRPNVVCEVEDPSDASRLPRDYPEVSSGDRDEWLAELVDWWQLDHPQLVSEKLAPFNHGERIRVRWGEQLQRVVRSLDSRGDSSRALVLLMSPRETGRYHQDERDPNTGSYPALVLVEFVLAERQGARVLDCCAYFRVQEMQYWWAVNVAELSVMQEQVRTAMNGTVQTGRIVTYSAIAHWKSNLPAVAVPVVDLLVDKGDRLEDLAFAAAYPNEASELARADWERVLADLSGEGRSEPPRPHIGAQRLRDRVGRLAGALSSPKLDAVAAALVDLCDQYAAFADTEKLNATAAAQIRSRVQTLSDAVEAALGPAPK